MCGPPQELLDHAFLRPTAAQAPAPVSAAPAVAVGSKSVELSKEQLHRLLVKASQAGASDVSQLSEQLFAQLYHGQASPEGVKLGGSASAGMAREQQQERKQRQPLLPLATAGRESANLRHSSTPATAASDPSLQQRRRQPGEG